MFGCLFACWLSRSCIRAVVRLVGMVEGSSVLALYIRPLACWLRGLVSSSRRGSGAGWPVCLDADALRSWTAWEGVRSGVWMQGRWYAQASRCLGASTLNCLDAWALIRSGAGVLGHWFLPRCSDAGALGRTGARMPGHFSFEQVSYER